MGKVFGNVRITIPGRPDLTDLPAVIKINGVVIDDAIEDVVSTFNTKLATKANATTVSAKADLSIIAPAYDDKSTYEVGDVVVHSGKLYQCVSDVDVAEEFDPTHWDETTLIELLPEDEQEQPK